MVVEEATMLGNAHITTILPVIDLDRARRFYGDTLGLAPAETSTVGGAVFRSGDGTDLELLPRPARTKAEHTALTFEVDDVVLEVGELETRGVKFEDYDLPGLKTEGHIAVLEGELAAWFKDPDGNILCLHQREQ
jgi:catechol 2,3-dioxygenase-like lactoylglutathione lyase family enzyme